MSLSRKDGKMPQNKAQKKSNLAHFSEALEGFCNQYDVDLQMFGEGIHWRLTGQAVLDCWPTTGKFWIKELPFTAESTDEVIERTGMLPYNYLELDRFLRGLFL